MTIGRSFPSYGLERDGARLICLEIKRVVGDKSEHQAVAKDAEPAEHFSKTDLADCLEQIDQKIVKSARYKMFYSSRPRPICQKSASSRVA